MTGKATKNTRLRPLILVAMAVAAMSGLAGYAGARPPDLDDNGRVVSGAEAAHASNQLDGTWIVTVNRVNPPPGAPVSFKSLITFAADGAMLETSSTGTALRGPAHGASVRVGDRL